MVETASNVSVNPQRISSEICWATPWNKRQAVFEDCFLLFIVLGALGLVGIVILWRSLWFLIPWRPSWTLPFVQEYAIFSPQLPRARTRRFSRYVVWLIVLLCVVIVVGQIELVMGRYEDIEITTAISIIILLYLLVRRPDTVPFDILLLVLILNFVRNAPGYSADHESIFKRVVNTGVPVLMLIVIFMMPMRPQHLPTKDISKPYSAPTAGLRSPEDNLTLWQFMTVSWLTPLIKLAAQRQLQEEDVWQLPYEFQHKRLHENFRLLKGTVVTRLIKANAIDLIILTILGIFETAAGYASPILLQRLLSVMADDNAPKKAAVTYAAIALVVRIAAAQSGVFSLWFGRRCYERSRGEMITMLYEKTLGRKISFAPADEAKELQSADAADSKADVAGVKPSLFAQVYRQLKHGLGKETRQLKKEPASMGKILNLMKNDVYEVAQRFWEFQRLITIPLNVIFAATLVVQFLGPSALVAITLIIVAQLINLGLARILIILEKHRRKATDDKLQIVSQFVEAIRHLRWYGWQNAWLSKIMDARQRELNWRVITGMWNVLIALVNSLGLETAPAIAFGAYTLITDGKLTVDVGFPALELMYMLTVALRDIPQLITTILNAWVAVDRIEDFMAEPNKDEDNSLIELGADLALQHASFAWPGAAEAVLVDISLVFPPGLTVICGEVAAGKTALLQALLGELDILSGALLKPETPIGYCSQTPWLQSMTIRDNILFSAQYNKARYDAVVKACALEPDLAELPAGDYSFIGENGIGLSGGQRARVALARAAYSESSILLLDDPLSALDHNTAEFIVNNLFIGPLFLGRTIILVTHRLEVVVPHAKQVIKIEAGQAMVVAHQAATKETLQWTESHPTPRSDDEQLQKQSGDSNAAVKFLEEEYRAQGGVKASVYWEYIKAGRVSTWLVLLVAIIFYRMTTIYQLWYLKDWGEAYQTKASHAGLLSDTDLYISSGSGLTDNFPPPDEDVRPWILGMLVLGLVRSIVGEIVHSIVLVIIYIAGKQMFGDIMRSVANATFRFYDVTPVGRLMNRMTSDIGVVDGPISSQFTAISWLAFSWLSSLGIIAFVTPVFLLFSAILTLVVILIFRQYLPTSQSLRRLEMVSLTPLMSNFGELLHGLVTVRAFQAQERFQDRVIQVVDNFQKMDHFYWSSQTWLMYRYDMLAAVSTFLITMLALASNITPGLTAFVLSAAAKFVVSTHSLCKQYGQLQMEFVSVERVVELLHLEQEPVGKVSPPAWWPSFDGEICFNDVTMRYAAHLEPALSGVSFTITAGSKTAILGRTGSGKSTLALAMLATILPEHGQISIDNIDLAEVDKQILRTKVTFLAQDPVLFPGTLRQNLDPLEEHSDDDCEAVLRQVCERQGWSLSTHIEGGGRNLSQGQRQLVGLTRAVLRRSAIIILDEATASIDMETSMQIQQVLHEEMKESTVITIAHRLEAVSNADYCIVLGNGRVIKQGPAAELLITGTDADDRS